MGLQRATALHRRLGLYHQTSFEDIFVNNATLRVWTMFAMLYAIGYLFIIDEILVDNR